MLGGRASPRCKCVCMYGGVQVSKEVNRQRRMQFGGFRQWRIAEQVSLEVLGVADEGGWGTHTTTGVDMSGTL